MLSITNIVSISRTRPPNLPGLRGQDVIDTIAHNNNALAGWGENMTKPFAAATPHGDFLPLRRYANVTTS